MNLKEAFEAIAGDADIIDVKNPLEGALGANFPWVIKQIRDITPRNKKVSCALGDVPNLPGSISLAASGAAALGVDYVKVGLYGLKTPEEAVYLLQNVNRAVKQFDPKIKVAAAGYADAQKTSGLNPMQIPNIAHEAQVDIAMLDTAVKDGKNLFFYQSQTNIKEFVDHSHSVGLEVALAGSLRKEDLPTVCSLGTDIVGLRGAACTCSDRVKGEMKRELVQELVTVVRQAEKMRA